MSKVLDKAKQMLNGFPQTYTSADWAELCDDLVKELERLQTEWETHNVKLAWEKGLKNFTKKGVAMSEQCNHDKRFMDSIYTCVKCIADNEDEIDNLKAEITMWEAWKKRAVEDYFTMNQVIAEHKKLKDVLLNIARNGKEIGSTACSIQATNVLKETT